MKNTGTRQICWYNMKNYNDINRIDSVDDLYDSIKLGISQQAFEVPAGEKEMEEGRIQ